MLSWALPLWRQKNVSLRIVEHDDKVNLPPTAVLEDEGSALAFCEAASAALLPMNLFLGCFVTVSCWSGCGGNSACLCASSISAAMPKSVRARSSSIAD